MFCKNQNFKQILKKVDNFLLQNIDKAISLVNQLKKMAESDVSSILVNLTKTNVDNIVLENLIKYLKSASFSLGIIKNISEMSSEEFLLWLVNHLKSLPQEQRNAQYLKISSLVSKHLDNTRYTGKFYDTMTQIRYYSES